MASYCGSGSPGCKAVAPGSFEYSCDRKTTIFAIELASKPFDKCALILMAD